MGLGIYKHYKGGLYFVKGVAVPLKEDEVNDKDTTLVAFTTAKEESTLDDVEVLVVHNKGIRGVYYTYKSDKFIDAKALYRGVDGQYWLRRFSNFQEYVEVEDSEMGDTYTMPRFEKVDGEYLFDTIVELLD